MVGVSKGRCHSLDDSAAVSKAKGLRNLRACIGHPWPLLAQSSRGPAAHLLTTSLASPAVTCRRQTSAQPMPHCHA